MNWKFRAFPILFFLLYVLYMAAEKFQPTSSLTSKPNDQQPTPPVFVPSSSQPTISEQTPTTLIPTPMMAKMAGKTEEEEPINNIPPPVKAVVKEPTTPLEGPLTRLPTPATTTPLTAAPATTTPLTAAPATTTTPPLTAAPATTTTTAPLATTLPLLSLNLTTGTDSSSRTNGTTATEDTSTNTTGSDITTNNNTGASASSLMVRRSDDDPVSQWCDFSVPPPAHLVDRSHWKTARLTGEQWAGQIRQVWSKVLVAVGEDIGSVPNGVIQINSEGIASYTIHGVYDCCARLGDSLHLDRLEGVVERFYRRKMLPILYVEGVSAWPFTENVLEPLAKALQAGQSRYNVGGKKVRALPFVVFTGCRDPGTQTFHRDKGGDEAANRFFQVLDTMAVHHWFQQQCDTTHRKVQCVPLGAPYHDDLMAGIHPILADRMMFRLGCEATKNYTSFGAPRPLKVLVGGWNYGTGARRRGIRDMVMKQLPAEHVHELNHRVSHEQLIKLFTEMAFVIAPAGGGWDSHRIAEAMLVGAIPIVWNSTNYRKLEGWRIPHHLWGDENRLYEDLPMIVVQDYSEVTAEKLKGWQQQIARNHALGKYKLEKLTSAYWANLMVKKAQDGFEAFKREKNQKK